MKKRNMTRKDSIALDKTSKQITVLDDQALDEVQRENKKLNDFMQQFLMEGDNGQV